MSEVSKTYTNGEVTITWEPDKCTHSKNCWKGLLPVFDPRRKPWIDAMAAGTQEIKNQIDKCPSKALGYFMNADKK